MRGILGKNAKIAHHNLGCSQTRCTFFAKRKPSTSRPTTDHPTGVNRNT
ncbi:MAG: hypothetical protein IT258_23565 [Saprospiraceae bacterium]|nr:hypothetical protein [Saprospiraceae bacterium]